MGKFIKMTLVLGALLCLVLTGKAQGFDQMKWQTIGRISAKEMRIITVVSRKPVSVILKDAVEFHLFEGGEAIALKFKSGKQCLYGFGVGDQKLTDQEEEQIEIAKQQKCAQEALEQQDKETKSDIIRETQSDESTKDEKSEKELSDSNEKLDAIRERFTLEGQYRFEHSLNNAEATDRMDKLALEGGGLLNRVSDYQKAAFLRALCWLGNRYMAIILPYLETDVVLEIYSDYVLVNTWRLGENNPTLQDVMFITTQAGYRLLGTDKFISEGELLTSNLLIYNKTLYDLLTANNKIR